MPKFARAKKNGPPGPLGKITARHRPRSKPEHPRGTHGISFILKFRIPAEGEVPHLFSDCASFVEFPFGLQITLVCLFWGVEFSQKYTFTVD